MIMIVYTYSLKKNTWSQCLVLVQPTISLEEIGLITEHDCFIMHSRAYPVSDHCKVSCCGRIVPREKAVALISNLLPATSLQTVWVSIFPSRHCWCFRICCSNLNPSDFGVKCANLAQGWYYTIFQRVTRRTVFRVGGTNPLTLRWYNGACRNSRNYWLRFTSFQFLSSNIAMCLRKSWHLWWLFLHYNCLVTLARSRPLLLKAASCNIATGSIVRMVFTNIVLGCYV